MLPNIGSRAMEVPGISSGRVKVERTSTAATLAEFDLAKEAVRFSVIFVSDLLPPPPASGANSTVFSCSGGYVCKTQNSPAMSRIR